MKKAILVSVGGMTLIMIMSKGIGFVKQVLIARFFGSSLETDIFFLASGILANLLFAFNTSLSSVILPAYRSKMDSPVKEGQSEFLSQLLTFMIPISLFITSIFIIVAPYISSIVASTYDSRALSFLTENIRIIAPSIIFAIMATVFTAVLNAHRDYLLPRLASTTISIVPILFILFFYQSLGIMTLVWAVPTAYLCQAVWTFMIVRKKTRIPFRLRAPGSEVKKVFILMIPVIIGSATQQVNQIVDKVIATSLGEGTVSALSYSAPLQDFVMVAFATSIVTVFFTELSSSASDQKIEQHKAYLIRGISMLCLILVPISIITALCAKDIVALLYQRGEFDERAVLLTASVLGFYGIGFLFYGIRELITRSFYAFEDTKTPTYNGIVTVVLNVVLSLTLSKYLGVGGIALATTIAGFISMILLVALLRRKLQGIGIKSFLPTAFKIIIAAFVMSASLLVCKNMMEDQSSFIRFAILSISSFAVYLLMLMLLKCKELFEILTIMKRKMPKRG